MTAGGLSLRVSLLNNQCFGSGVATFVVVPVHSRVYKTKDVNRSDPAIKPKTYSSDGAK